MVKTKKSLVSRFRQRRKQKQKLKVPKNKIISGKRYKLIKAFKTKEKQTKRYNGIQRSPIGNNPNWSIRRVKVKGKFAIYARQKDFA